MYDPPAGTFPSFPTSEFIEKLPQSPTVNPSSAAWLSHLGTIGLGHLQFAANSAGEASDFGFPVYRMASVGAADVLTVKVHCTKPWGTCAPEGKTITVDSRERPEDGGASNEDSHMAIVDTHSGNEYDFFGVTWPPKSGTLTVEYAGICPLSGPGYANCRATAAGTAISLGIIRAKDLVKAVQTDGTLPYALATSVKCSDGYVPPVTSGDGKTAGCPPEGARVYLALHDSQVNASSATGIVKAILRTIDEDHYGMYLFAINGGQDGFSLITESDLTYTVFGLPAPLVTQLIPLAEQEGMDGTTAYSNVYHLPLDTPGIDLSTSMKFL